MNDPPKVIIASILAMGGLLTWRGIRSGTLTPRTYAALIVVALILLLMGTFAPELAAAFAVLALVAVLLSGTRDLEEIRRVAGRA